MKSKTPLPPARPIALAKPIPLKPVSTIRRPAAAMKRSGGIVLPELFYAVARFNRCSRDEAAESIFKARVELGEGWNSVYDAMSGRGLAKRLPNAVADFVLAELWDQRWWDREEEHWSFNRHSVRRWLLSETDAQGIFSRASNILSGPTKGRETAFHEFVYFARDRHLAYRNRRIKEEMNELSKRDKNEQSHNAPTSPAYLDRDNERYSGKLAAAARAWEAVRQVPPGKTAKQALEAWLTDNAKSVGLLKLDGTVNKQAISECATVANWKPKGGAPMTPTRGKPPR